MKIKFFSTLVMCVLVLAWSSGSVALEEGKTAFVRIKKAEVNLLDDSKESKVFQLEYGEKVFLLKNDAVEHKWLISKGEEKGWLHEKFLTDNLNEINYLRNINRIPTSMNLIYVKNGILGSHGSQYLAMFGPPKSPFAKVGNAVIVDNSAADTSTLSSLLPSCGDTQYKIKSQMMYFCTSEEGYGCFECIDLIALSPCKE